MKKPSGHMENASILDPPILPAPKYFVPAPLPIGQPPSVMRVMAASSLGAGIALAVIGLWLHEDLSQLAILSSVFVVPAFTGKAVQKHIETRNGAKQ